MQRPETSRFQPNRQFRVEYFLNYIIFYSRSSSSLIIDLQNVVAENKQTVHNATIPRWHHPSLHGCIPKAIFKPKSPNRRQKLPFYFRTKPNPVSSALTPWQAPFHSNLTTWQSTRPTTPRDTKSHFQI